MAALFIFDESIIPKNSNLCKFEFDGDKIKNIEELNQELIRIMRFPSYFNGNFNSLEECLNDLSWISDDCDFEIKILHFHSFLINESEDVLITFFEILKDIDLNYHRYENDHKRQSLYIVLEKTSKAINLLKKIDVDNVPCSANNAEKTKNMG